MQGVFFAPAEGEKEAKITRHTKFYSPRQIHDNFSGPSCWQIFLFLFLQNDHIDVS
jgi:hypothetical protein